MTDAQYTIQFLKNLGYSDSDIATYANISRQAIIDIRKGRSSGKKVIGKLWALKSHINSGSDDLPLPTPKKSTEERATRIAYPAISSDTLFFVLFLVILCIVIFIAIRKEQKVIPRVAM